MSAVKAHLISYGEATSVKGVSKIIKSKYYAMKAVWLLALITGMSMAIMQLTTLITSYLKYETTTQISDCTDCVPQFPDVTVCNLHPLALPSKFDDLLQFQQYLDIMKIIRNTEHEDLDNYLESIKISDTELDSMYYDTYYSLAGYFQNIDDEALLEKVANKNLNVSFVSFCKWYDWQDRVYTKEDCMEQSLYFFTTPDYSVCTTIHLNQTNTQANNTEVKGLEAVLYLNDFERALMVGYEHNIVKSQAQGARVLIHPPNSLPEMRKGFNIAPGHEVSIHLEARDVTWEPAPYSHCTDKAYLEQELTADMGKYQIDKFIYNDQDAVSMCQQDYMVNKCGCFHPGLPVTRQMKAKYNANGCIQIPHDNASMGLFEVPLDELDIVASLKHVLCYYGTKQNDEEEQQHILNRCQFRQPCHQTIYSHKVYQSPWPHQSFEPAFYCRQINQKDENCRKVGQYRGDTELKEHFEVYSEILADIEDQDEEEIFERLQDEDLIERNFLQLKVLFLEKNVEIYKQVPKVSASYMTGTVGGVLNLWIGITFFTLIELIDFVYTLIVDVRLKKAKQTKDKDENKVSPMENNHFAK